METGSGNKLAGQSWDVLGADFSFHLVHSLESTAISWDCLMVRRKFSLKMLDCMYTLSPKQHTIIQKIIYLIAITVFTRLRLYVTVS